MCKELDKYIGKEISVGLKRPNGAFFITAKLESVSNTHVFVLNCTNGQREAYLLSDIVKMEFPQVV